MAHIEINNIDAHQCLPVVYWDSMEVMFPSTYFIYPATPFRDTTTMRKHHLSWNESSQSVGIALIDSQHRELIELVNKISDEVVEREQSETIQANLWGGLIQFAHEHFAFEERLMAEYDFPGMENHIMEHRKLLQQLNNLIKADLRARHKAALVSAFLTDWTEQHILYADKELGEFLATKGLG